jgi:hypothetical protein
VPNNEFGDFQTPPALAAKVLRALPDRSWGRVLEPTCGTGTFLLASARAFPGAEIIGIEIQPDYVAQASLASAQVITQDIFSIDLGTAVTWSSTGPLLIVGNPPWVTSAHLGRLASGNRPARVNVKGLAGYDAMTGASNFDIAEYIWLKLLTELRDQSPVISLLCKTQVARNVLEHCARFSLPVSAATMHLIDAAKWFNAAVDACLFTVQVNAGPDRYACDLYPSLDSGAPARRIGVVGGRLVADTDAYARSRQFDGVCPLEWRQGMKHDAAPVMELTSSDQGPLSRAGTVADVEADHLYPLLKCTDVFHRRTTAGKLVIVPQRVLGAETASLAQTAPRLWGYLVAHAGVLDNRKSAIYRRRPRFSVFGLGDYSFAPYKVAVSGLHKSARFHLVGPDGGKPVFFDDACYFLPFTDAPAAAVVAALLQTEQAGDLLRALAFWDAKRPVTKKLLQRIDLLAILEAADTAALIGAVARLLAGLGAAATTQAISAAIATLRVRWQPEPNPEH